MTPISSSGRPAAFSSSTTLRAAAASGKSRDRVTIMGRNSTPIWWQHARKDRVPAGTWLVSRFRNSHDLDIGSGRISESKDTSNLLIPVSFGFEVRPKSISMANFETTTLGLDQLRRQGAKPLQIERLAQNLDLRLLQ